MQITLPNEWEPRAYQVNAWKALQSGVKRAVLIWHRRAGKDDLCLHFTATQIFQRVGTYWHMLPQASQARKAIWNAVNPLTGRRRIDDAFPEQLRRRTLNNEMFIEFINGSTWQVVGSDNYNSLVGSPPIGVTVSEWALANPLVSGYLDPILDENGGWMVFISTPRGKNHCYDMYKSAASDKQWFSEILTVHDTKRFDAEKLVEIQQRYKNLYGGDDGDSLFKQEYLCDFGAALVGTYFARLIDEARQEGRLSNVPYTPAHPVYTAWDLGRNDSTVIWFYQRIGTAIHVIDFHEENYQQLDHFVTVVKGKKYAYGGHFLPHDAGITDYSATGGKSRLEMFRSHLGNVQVIPRINSKMDAINAIRATIPTCYFDKTKCDRGIEGLSMYRREWDAERKVYKNTPVHDWTSHIADAFDTLARSLSRIEDPVQSNVKPYYRVYEPWQ